MLTVIYSRCLAAADRDVLVEQWPWLMPAPPRNQYHRNGMQVRYPNEPYNRNNRLMRQTLLTLLLLTPWPLPWEQVITPTSSVDLLLVIFLP